MHCSPRLKLLLLALALWLLELGNYLASEQKAARVEYEHKIALLTAHSDELEQEKRSLEESYGNSLRRIVAALRDRDVVIGGGTETGGQDVGRLYDAIINEAGDYMGLLSDVSLYFDARAHYQTGIPCVWPLEHSANTRITSGYGWRLSPFGAWVSFHSGIDIMSDEWNAKVLATADGTVAENWPPPDGFWKGHPELGGMVRVQHQDGYETIYGHMSEEFVREGQAVKRGDVIGIVGSTGRAVGRHLHYEVHRNGRTINPLDTLRF